MDKLLIGDDDDLVIFHDGVNSNIRDEGTGGLFLRTNALYARGYLNNVASDMIEARAGAEVKLHYDGNLRLETTTDGVRVRSDLTVDDDANFGNNTVQITNNKVTASRFEGTADIASQAPVYGTEGQGLGNHNFALMMSPSFLVSGTVQKLHRDQNIKFNTGSNELRCDGDIIAFASDDRLKTNKVGITNALDKVNSLSGFTYNWNEIASEHGNQFKGDKRHAGVSAQEVQKVLPEAVAPAPFNDEYLTVKYDKIVPLLIEAIKELSDKVSALEDKLNN